MKGISFLDTYGKYLQPHMRLAKWWTYFSFAVEVSYPFITFDLRFSCEYFSTAMD